MPVRRIALEQLPATLSDRFDSADGLIWIGAGVSSSMLELAGGQVGRMGVPTAAALERHLKAWTEPPHPTAETLAELAGLYVFQHGRPRLDRLLRTVYGRTRRKTPSFYDLVSQLPPSVRIFVTTNYDSFLERSLAERKPVVVVRDVGLERVTNARPVVYKPHGDALSPTGCVIATADYDAWQQTTGNLSAHLISLYLQHTVVAIAYRAQDDNFRRLLREVNTGILERSGKPHTMYVVIPNPHENEFAAYAGGEYDLVLVPATGEQFLEWLVAQLAERRRARQADEISRLVDPSEIRVARTATIAAFPSPIHGHPPAADVADARWLHYAEQLVSLAQRQADLQRPVDGLITRAEAARAFRLGGDSEHADDIFRQVLCETVHVRRDAALTERLLGKMRLRDQGAGSLPDPNDDDTKMWTALAEILNGVPDKPPPFVEELTSRLIQASPIEAFDAVNYRLERLRGEHAVTAHDFARASEAFARAAQWARDEVQRADCSIRSHLFAGLQADPAESEHALEQLRILNVPRELECDWQRAMAWVATLNGDLDLAANAFERAAAIAVEKLDVVTAAFCYRGAAWVEQQRLTRQITFDGPARAADRLEQSWLKAEDLRCATVNGLLEEADEALREREWPTAWHAAARAARLAYDQIDPSGVEQADTRLANAWLAVVENASDEFSVFWASHYVGTVIGEVSEDARETWSRPLRNVIARESSAQVRASIVKHLALDAVGRRERTGFLVLLAEFAVMIDGDQLTTLIVPAIITGLALGWRMNSALDTARAACRLLQQVYDRLTPEDAASVRTALETTEARAPLNRLDDVYLALAQATAMAPIPVDGGASLATHLLSTLVSGRSAPQTPHYLNELHLAIAALTERSDDATRTRLVLALETEARAGAWAGIAILAARGMILPADIADVYLSAMISRIRSLTVDASPKKFGFPARSDDSRLTRYAAVRGSHGGRQEAISATLGLLLHDGQWAAQRSMWVSFLIELLTTSPERVLEALPTLLRGAGGDFKEPGNIREQLPNHPLGTVRIQLGIATDLRAQCLVALGRLWRVTPLESRDRVRSTLTASLTHADDWAREAAVIGISESAEGDHAVAGDETTAWQRDALIGMLNDYQAAVRDAALKALTRLASKNS